jgi:hypothetical protein
MMRQIFLSNSGRESDDVSARRVVESVARDLDVRVVSRENLRGSLDAVADALRSSDLLIVDATSWRPNVAFELGVALGARIPAAVFLHSGARGLSAEQLDPALLERFQVHSYADSDDLARQLQYVLETYEGRQHATERRSANSDSDVAFAEFATVFNRTFELNGSSMRDDLRAFSSEVRKEFFGRMRELASTYGRFNDPTGFDEAIEPTWATYFGLIAGLTATGSSSMAEEARSIGRLPGTGLSRDVPPEWNRMTQWLAWQLTNGAGAIALMTGQLKAIRYLYDAVARGRELTPRSLATLSPGPAGDDVISERGYPGTPDPVVEHIVGRLERVTARSPVSLSQKGHDYLLDFNFLVTLLAGQGGGINMRASWAAYPHGGLPLAQALEGDSTILRDLSAQVFREPVQLLQQNLGAYLSRGLQSAEVPHGVVISEAAHFFGATVPPVDG